MDNTEIIRETKKLFGKDRKYLKKLLYSYTFDGSDTSKLEKIIKTATCQPFSLNYGIFDEVVESIKYKRKIDTFWIGDLSWNCMILLNSDLKKGYDWDKKLCNACNGTARVCEFSISDSLPVFTYDLYYMTFNKKDKWYEFGPITKTSLNEKRIITSVTKALEENGRTFIDRSLAIRKYKDLYTDTNKDGGATIYDCLFSDTHPYQQEYLRFLENVVDDRNHNCTTTWKEYFEAPGKLLRREEWRYYGSNNTICIATNKNNEITEVKVYRDAGRFKYREFSFNIDKKIKEIVKREKNARPVPRKRP